VHDSAYKIALLLEKKSQPWRFAVARIARSDLLVAALTGSTKIPKVFFGSQANFTTCKMPRRASAPLTIELNAARL
jgi:hypothetical protein